MPVDHLNIEKFATEYRIPIDHPNPESLTRRLDETVTRELPATLGIALRKVLPAGRDDLVFIRRLTLDLDLDAGWDSENIARIWAERFVRALRDAIKPGGPAHDLCVFANRTAFVKAFVMDLAAGRAWHHWYYRSFDGLKHLPTSAAVRTALCMDSETAFHVLSDLSDRELDDVVNSMTSADTRRVLDAMADSATNASDAECLDAIWAAIQASASGVLEWITEDGGLRLYLRVAGRAHHLRGRSLIRAASSVAEFARLVVQLTDGERERLIDALTKNVVAAVIEIAGPLPAERLAPISAAAPVWLPVLAAMAQSRAALAKKVTPPGQDERRFTEFGGAFLLLPLLDELAMQEPWFRLAVLARCFGRNAMPSVMRDPMLRDLLGVPPHDPPMFKRGGIRSICNSLRTRLASLGATDGSRLVTVRVTLQDLRAKLLIDAKRGIWVAWQRRARRTLHTPDTRVADDLEFLATADDVNDPCSLDAASVLGAQALLRQFACRLPGFSSSSLRYLSHNFLKFSASLEVSSADRRVRLGRPTLNVVLNMTGAVRASYRLSWLDDKPFRLFQGDE